MRSPFSKATRSTDLSYRLRVWYGSSVAHRFTVAAMVLSMAIVIAVGGTAYYSLYKLLDEVQHNRLHAEANVARQHLYDHLDHSLEDVVDLSARSLVSEGLSATSSQMLSLRLFLQEYQSRRPEVLEIGLYDWAGESLASSSGKPQLRNGLVAEVVLKNTPMVWMLTNDKEQRLLMAAPVRRLTNGSQPGPVEGALISEISLASLAASVLGPMNSDIRLHLVDGHGTAIFGSAQERVNAESLTAMMPLDDSDLLATLHLEVVAALPKVLGERPLRRLQMVFVALALLAALVTYLGARALARRVTEPLTRLSRHAQEIASDGVAGLRDLEVVGYDEVGWMATAFNSMVRSLQEVYGELEARVAQRTQEMERRELYLRAILDNFPFMVWLKDAECRFLSVNQVMAETCGRSSPEVMVGLTDGDIWPQDMAEYYRADDMNVMASRRERMVEEPIDDHGQRKWFEVFKKPVIDASGQVLGTVGFARDITERKQAEKAMRLRDRAIMSTSDGIVISDMTRPDQPVIFVNPAFEAITGYSMKEVLGRNCKFLQGDESNQPALLELKAAIKESRECRVVLHNYRKDGRAFWNELTLSPVRDDRGVVTHYVGVQHDITRDMEARDALAASEHRLTLTIDALRDGLWDWNMLDDSLYHSPSWASMMGYRPEELTGTVESFQRCLPEGERERVVDALRSHLRGETEVFVCEHRMQRKDGAVIWVSDRGRVVGWSEDGRPARMVGTTTDISERYRAEREIMSWMQRLDSILTLSPDGYIYFDAQGRVASVNLAFEKMTGLLSGDALELPIADLAVRLQSLADPTQPFPDLRQAFLDAQGSHAGPARGHIYLVQPANRVLTYELRMNDSGDSSVLYLRDVTRETEVDRMKSEFLSTAAHELRTPMVSVMGFSELLLRRAYDADTAKDMLETIHRQSKRLTGLLNELLDLARIEARAGKDFDYKVQPLAVVVRDSISATASRGEAGVVQLEMPESLPLVRADGAKLQQALLNILSNAFKYSPEGGDVDVRVFTLVVERCTRVCVAVQDHGIGMTPDQTARVFERFFRADPSGNIPGTGLGMSLVKEIMEIHGGGVYVESEPGKGTTVTLWLPAAHQEQEALAA